jgi:hypothetical protein
MKRSIALVSLVALCLSACAPSTLPVQTGTGSSVASSLQASSSPSTVSTTTGFGDSIHYTEPQTVISADLSAPFSVTDAKNLSDIKKAYGMTLTSAQTAFLSQNKFLVMNLLDTNLRPTVNGDTTREFFDLYNLVAGPNDYKERSQANSVYLSSDVFFNAYNNLYVELLKEMENKAFFQSMKDLSTHFYDASVVKLAAATTDTDKQTWTSVRNYFAVSSAIFSTAAEPLTNGDYFKDGQQLDPEQVQADFQTKDAMVDTAENVSAYIKALHLDPASEKAVLTDIGNIYKAGDKAVPAVFQKEFADYYAQEGVDFQVDFSQFTPRGTYTSSSLRRQYFRGMNWFIQIPFFVKSQALTKDAFAITQLMAEHPADLKKYNQIETAINFLVGKSDDLMPTDYMQALNAAKGKPDQEAAVMQYLATTHDPEIKSLAAMYDSVGTEQSADVLLKTKGMHVFSGKFILDSFWTGQLTQGDEAIKPGYTQKLPPMASSLEVMSLLGSEYAKSKIPTLDFYKPETSKAIDQAMSELSAKESALDTAFWQSNVYNGWLWTIKGLFSFDAAHQAALPAFMQSPMWDMKTLMTGAGFWTELRHATILYAKQSFAELGGGPGPCDDRKIPDAPKGYIEPQPIAYARLQYLASRTNQGLKDQGYTLDNMGQLDTFVSMMQKVQDYTAKELGNTALKETITSHQETDDSGKTCTVYQIEDGSDWEALRTGIVHDLKYALPLPTEGPILSAKDRRAAIIADVHTGGDSSNPTRILYEGVGVPNVILVAVKDSNGPRFALGFTYSQYEMTQPYGGQRLTDEDWQKNFYTGDDTNMPYTYTAKNTWPAVNSWYSPLFDIK